MHRLQTKTESNLTSWSQIRPRLRKRGLVPGCILTWVIVPFFLALGFVISVNQNEVFWAISIGLSLLAWPMLIYAINLSRAKKYTDLCVHGICDEGLHVETSKQDAIIKWSAFSRVIDDEELLFVFVRGHRLPIPILRKAFSKEEIDHILTNIRMVK